MSDYDGGAIRPEDDYARARENALNAGRDLEGDQAWKRSQDEMFRAQQEAEWRRRDHERDAAGRNGDSSYTPPPSGDSGDRGGAYGAGATAGRRGHRKYPVSFAMADSMANSSAAMFRIHPGLFQLVYRGIALSMCWPIPIMQSVLAGMGIHSKLARFPILLAGWMVYLMLLSWVLVHIK